MAGGLGAGGHMGLTRTFELIQEELIRTMELIGVKDLEDIHDKGEKLRRRSIISGTAYFPEFVF